MNEQVQRPHLETTPRHRMRVSQGQQDTYLGKGRYNQVIAVSGGKKEKHLKMHLNYNWDVQAVILKFVSTSNTNVIQVLLPGYKAGQI